MRWRIKNPTSIKPLGKILVLLILVTTVLSGCDRMFWRQSFNPHELKVAAYSPTVRAMLDRGALNCGVSTGVEGFSWPNETGQWQGFDVDLCRALAAVVFNDHTAVNYVPLGASARFNALLNKEVDILSRNTTWTLTRDTLLGLGFAGITFYDGQSFLVSAGSSIQNVEDLEGAAICVLSGTTTELNLADHFRAKDWHYEPVNYDTEDPMMRGFQAGRCTAVTADQAKLYSLRNGLPDPYSVRVLTETISKEPLGPAVRDKDPFWYDIVQWTHFAMITAEELNVGQANIDSAMSASIPSVRRLLGQEGNLGEGLGLTNDWVVRILTQVGNYGEVYDRHLGRDGLGIERQLNELWINGGLIYAPPMR